MLSDAAFASVLTGLYRANLLLPQLKPPVISDAQANRAAAARAEAKQPVQQRDNRQPSHSSGPIAVESSAAQRSAQAAERVAAAKAQQSIGKATPSVVSRTTTAQVDHATFSRVSVIAQETLANGDQRFSGAASPAVEDGSRSTALYSLKDVVEARGVKVDTLLMTTQSITASGSGHQSVPVAASSVADYRRDAVVRQYQRNNVAPSFQAADVSGASGLNVHA